MLSLTFRQGQRIIILPSPEPITVQAVKTHRDKVKIGFEGSGMNLDISELTREKDLTRRRQTG